MIAIAERELGMSIWSRLADKEKIYNAQGDNVPSPLENAFILPRYYDRQTLDLAFGAIKDNLSVESFNTITYGEHHLIFYESARICSDIAMIKDPLIYHFGDSTIQEIFTKYHRYGQSSRIFRNTHYEFLMTYSTHKRKNIPLLKRAQFIPLFIARSIPFLLGYAGL